MRRRPPTAPMTRPQHRRGAVLVLFAMLLFVLIPLASLVLQSGWLTLTRRQMQSGTDVAATEALRGRDEFVAPGDTEDPDYPMTSNKQRRDEAAALANALFDDDLNTTAGDAFRFSAGPVINFATSSPPNGPTINDGTFIAGRLIEESDQEEDHQYDPMLRRNLADDSSGDIVSGTYGRFVTDPMTGETTIEEPAGHREEINGPEYIRDDFLPGDSDRAVLVRLRRSGENELNGVRSSGPRVPFLFGRGPFGGPDIAEEGETDFMSFAEQGSVVRATSIADAVPAWTVGRHTPNRSSAAEFFIDENVWRSAVAANATTLVVNVEANGRLVDTSSPPAPIGWLYTADDPNDNPDEGPPTALTIGVRLFEDARTALVDMSVSAYVPLAFDADPNPASTRHLICGFIRVTISGSAPGPWTLTPTGEARPIASENASAIFVSQDGVALSADALSQFRIFANDDDLRATLLHAPALRRTY